MRVDGFTQVHGPQGIRAPHHLHGPDRAAPAQAGTAGPVDKLDISPAAQKAIEAAEAGASGLSRVAQIRQQISDGTYETPQKLDRALDRLLDEIG